MLDGVLVANELIDVAVRNKKSCLFLKVDFEKAYDKISWNFFIFLLKKMGFSVKWCSWMEACIFSSHMSILVNGSPNMEFKVERGLRQSDPLSPFLFVMVTEAVTDIVKKAVYLGMYSGFRVSSGLSYDILEFIDDTQLICE